MSKCIIGGNEYYTLKANGMDIQSVVYNGTTIWTKPSEFWGLKFVPVISGSTIKIKNYGSPNPVSIIYSTDGTRWNTYTINSAISVESQIWFASSSNKTFFSTDYSNYYSFEMSGDFYVSGNVQSLLSPTISIGNAPSGCFSFLFNECPILSAPELPAMTVGESSYECMFRGCSKLTNPPKLPATVLGEYCYSQMFYESGITKMPDLPALGLEEGCYYQMFKDCNDMTSIGNMDATSTAHYACFGMFGGSGIAKSPYLHTETLDSSCYSYMFNNCINLKEIRTEQSSFGDSCSNWVNGVSSSGSFYCNTSKLGNNSTIERGIASCPDNWVVYSI